MVLTDWKYGDVAYDKRDDQVVMVVIAPDSTDYGLARTIILQHIGGSLSELVFFDDELYPAYLNNGSWERVK